MTVIKYCPACGAKLDEEGICTREACARRKLQLKARADSPDISAESGDDRIFCLVDREERCCSSGKDHNGG